MNSSKNYELPIPEENEPDAVPVTYNRRKVSLGTTVFLVICAVLITAAVTFIITVTSTRNQLGLTNGSVLSRINAKLVAINEILNDEYVGDIDEDLLVSSALKGYMYGLGDRYANYFTAEEYNSNMSDLSGNGVGIGVNLTYNAEHVAIEVLSVFPDSPAFEAGIKEGDLIAYIYVNGESKSIAELTYEGALDALIGEKGSSAEFTVFRGNEHEEILEFSIIRDEYTQYSVFHHLYEIDNTIGFIRITNFDYNTPEQFKNAIKDLTEQDVRGIILDVRYNLGGEVNSVCKVLDILLPEGTVLRTVDKKGNEEVLYTSDENELKLPMAVLVNESTASAAELFAAALRDYDKAFLVGTNTYGKGSMQTTIPFGDGTGFKYTSRYYCPPFSDNFDGKGLAPDVEVELAEELQLMNFFKIMDSDDNQLATAYNELLKSFN